MIQGRSGLTLVDLVVSLTFVSILTLLLGGWARSVITDVRRQQDTTELQEAVALTLDILIGEIRNAGFSAGTLATEAVVAATEERLEIHSDFDGDGSFTGSHERLVFAYRASNRQVTRASGQGSGQLLVSDVPPGGFRLTFYDRDRAQLVPGSNGLTTEQRAAVRRIDIHLAVERPGAGSEVRRQEATASLCLRNVQGGG